jgi:hypothetical protein
VLPTATVTGITVAPSTTNLPQGPSSCTELTSTANYSDGTSGPVAVDWSSPTASLDAGLVLAPAQNSESTEVCLAPNVAAQTYTVTAADGAVTGTADVTVCASTTHLVAIVPTSLSIDCATGHSRCVGMTADALVRYCNTSSVVNVNTEATWAVSPANPDITVIDGLACYTGATCPTDGGSYTVTATYGGHEGTAALSVQ